jgi:uncharacterized membrane protein
LLKLGSITIGNLKVLQIMVAEPNLSTMINFTDKLILELCLFKIMLVFKTPLLRQHWELMLMLYSAHHFGTLPIIHFINFQLHLEFANKEALIWDQLLQDQLSITLDSLNIQVILEMCTCSTLNILQP